MAAGPLRNDGDVRGGVKAAPDQGVGFYNANRKSVGSRGQKSEQTWLRAESGRVWVKLDSDRQISAQLGSMYRWFGLDSTRLKTQRVRVGLGSTRESHTKCM
jgi:hypothetical protein